MRYPLMDKDVDHRSRRERTIAIAIDKDKHSQYALRWAADHLANRNQILRLVHVRERPPSSDFVRVRNDGSLIEQHIDNQTKDLLLAVRCFCRRRQIQFETIVLEDQHVVKALNEYVNRYGVEILLLGGAPRNGLSRLFKSTDIPGSLMKRAPDFCNVFVITKGKISAMRLALQPAPAISAAGGAVLAQNHLNTESVTSGRNERLFDAQSAFDGDHVPLGSSGRPSMDSTFLSCYENLESELNEDYSFWNSDSENYGLPLDPSRNSTVEDRDFEPLTPGARSHDEEDYLEEMKRLKIELKQTMEMYHAACKEALAAKQKVMGLQKWKMEEEKSLVEARRLAREAASAMEEKGKANYDIAVEAAAAAAAKKLVEIEVEKRVTAELEAMREAEEKRKILDALCQSNLALKYESLFHMTVVLFLFYLYFSLSL